jgi:hypothetical protein
MESKKSNRGSIKKGEVRNPKGRGLGVPNRTTSEIRQAYQNLVELNLDNMKMWLEQVGEEDPYKAVSLMLQLSEYFIPKMTRTEITGQDGTPLYTDIKVEIINPNEDTDYPTISAN